MSFPQDTGKPITPDNQEVASSDIAATKQNTHASHHSDTSDTLGPPDTGVDDATGSRQTVTPLAVMEHQPPPPVTAFLSHLTRLYDQHSESFRRSLIYNPQITNVNYNQQQQLSTQGIQPGPAVRSPQELINAALTSLLLSLYPNQAQQQQPLGTCALLETSPEQRHSQKRSGANETSDPGKQQSHVAVASSSQTQDYRALQHVSQDQQLPLIKKNKLSGSGESWIDTPTTNRACYGG